MIKRLCLLLFCIAWSPCVCLSETLVSCPQSDSCNISIYKSSNSTIFGSHNITLISPKDDQGNNLPLSSSCAEPFFFIEERNRCESTETACSSEGVFNPLTHTCETGTICGSTGGTLDSALGTCRKYPDCDLGGTFNPDPESMWCEADVIADYSCPAGDFREVNGEGRCEISPHCIEPGVYNTSTGLCEVTVTTQCPDGGSFSQEHNQCEATASSHMCYTNHSMQMCYAWSAVHNPYNLPTRDDCFMDFVGACFYYVFVNGECREVFNAYQNLNENTCLASHDTCTDSGGQTYPARWEPARLSCPGSPSMDCFPYPSSACPGNNPPNNSTIVCERNASPSRSCDYTTSCSGLSGNFSKSRCRLATYWLYEVCPEGYTANGSSCTAQPSYQTCPNGFMQDETLCYRNPDPCPPEWSFDNVDAGTNLCYMYVQASYSCPTNYDLTEIDGEYHCIGVPFCRNAGYTFNNTSRYCESPACSISYSYNPSGICTSGNLCPPSAIFDPDNNLCYLNIEVDEVESSPEDIANTIICTISENGDSINATLNLYDQEAYDYPYANAPGYGIDPSLDGTNRDNPVCVHDDIHRTDACKWQRYNDDNEWLNDMGVPLNSWIIYGNTLVHSLTLGYLVDSNTGFSEDDNICARDINEDGNITENEIMMCLETPQGGLCPIELAECEVSTTPIVCPGNGTWDPDRNRCWKATTDDNLLCRIGSWVPEHNQCEATIECPAAAGHTPAYNNEHDICEYPITCPDNGTWHNTRDVCELMPVCNTTLNGNRPSYNVGAQRCETPITTEYNCPAGALKYVRNGTTICTRLPLCNTGDSYVCRNHRCERAATPVCPSGHTLENNRCYMSAELDNCYTEREVTRLTSSRVYRLCARAYDRCSKSCPSWSWDEPITCRICDNYGEWYGGGINNLPSACQGTTTETICRLSNECSPFGGTWSRAGTYGYAMEPPTCYARDSYGERTGPRCQGNSRPSRSISVGVDQYPYVTMIGKNTGALVCYYKEFWGVYTCPSGYTLDGNRCWRQPNYTCPSGYTLSGNICYRAPSCSTYGSGWAFDSSLNPDSACPTGYGLCWTNSTPVTVCPTGYTIDGSLCTHYSDHSCPSTTYRFSTSTGMCQYSGFGCTGSYALDTVFNVCGFSDVCPEGTNHDVVNDVCASSRICVDPYELSTAENLCLSFEYSCPTYYHVDLIDDICYHDWPDLCPYGTEYTCMNNNGLWQCSPHICDAFNNVLEDTDTIEGENDIKEIGFEEDGSCAGEIYIFRGFDKRCRTSGTTTSYVNCCGTASSDECINNLWLGLQPCNAREKDLACRKTANLCIEVGEYCSKRIKLLSGSSCIEHKKTYCCFGSKFGRVLQEQGRPLLKDFDPAAPFGTPENPNCDGFTPEQFSLLEWEEIDLTELYPDIEVMPMKDFEDSVNTRFQNQLNNFKLPGQ